VPDDWEPAIDVIAERVPAEILRQAAPIEESLRLARLQAEAAEEHEQARAAIEHAPPESEMTLRQKLEDAEQRERELLAALESLSVRHLPVYEHPQYMQRAFENAQRRILIVSPWVRAEVVDTEFLGRLRKALDRNVDVYIGYGIGDDGRERRPARAIERDKAAEGELRRVAERYRNFHLAKFGDTHAKVLVCDSRFSIVSSFNWLSFRGDRHLRFRDERGMYVGIPEKVDALFDEYVSRFD
jgi:phosphatidylserine/phosphatidylglycerophosphate/cardiolipin synthase-like enzyme